MKVLVTGAAGNGGIAVTHKLIEAGFSVRMADIMPSKEMILHTAEFIRCDMRSPGDVKAAVQGVDAVVHLAAWHCAHQPPVSDETIFGVNVDGTFHLLEACRAFGVQSIVYASSMAYGHGSVYGVTKVIGEDLCRAYHEITGASIAMLRYHEFIPRPYLEFGSRLLYNGVDRSDMAQATVAALQASIERKFGLFTTIVHTNHGMPAEVKNNFIQLGPDWCQQFVINARELIEKYHIKLPVIVEQHDLTEAERILNWRPQVGFIEFLQDLQERDARGEDVLNLWVPL
jgi:nucleoside-diphosphate-sugar epimerase